MTLIHGRQLNCMVKIVGLHVNARACTRANMLNLGTFQCTITSLFFIGFLDIYVEGVD
jgi:hypothetical protein